MRTTGAGVEEGNCQGNPGAKTPCRNPQVSSFNSRIILQGSLHDHRACVYDSTSLQGRRRVLLNISESSMRLKIRVWIQEVFIFIKGRELYSPALRHSSDIIVNVELSMRGWCGRPRQTECFQEMMNDIDIKVRRRLTTPRRERICHTEKRTLVQLPGCRL